MRALVWMSRFMGGLSAVLVGWIVLASFLPHPSRGPSLVAECPVVDLGETQVGSHSITFQLRNLGETPCCIVGHADSCGTNSCLSAKNIATTVLPPGARTEVICEVAVGHPGAFNSHLTLYVNDGGLREIILEVNGIGFETE